MGSGVGGIRGKGSFRGLSGWSYGVRGIFTICCPHFIFFCKLHKKGFYPFIKSNFNLRYCPLAKVIVPKLKFQTYYYGLQPSINFCYSMR